MRPRKTILLYCQDENERSVLTLLLELHFYRIIGGISALPPLADLCIVVDDRTLETVTMAEAIAALHPAMHMLVIPAKTCRTTPICYPAHAEVLRLKWKPEWLLERVMVLMARKPGPKKGTWNAGVFTRAVSA